MNARLLRILDNKTQNYPHALAKLFPRVLGQIMAMWDSPGIDTLFAELMISKRSSRQGFPPEVASDIIYLSMVHTRLRESKKTDNPWRQASEEIKSKIEQQGIPFSPQGFIHAAELGRRDVVALFLIAGVNVDTFDERRWTPLMVASFNGEEEMAKLLIKGGADVHHKDSVGYTPLHWAAFNGFSKVVDLLLSRQAEVNARSKHGWTPLLQAATRGHLPVSSMLIDHGADVNAASNDGWTSLHKAAANGHYPEVRLLLKSGASVKPVCGDGMTALDLAMKNKHMKIAAVLYGRE